MSRCGWTSRRRGQSSRGFGRRVATVVDARSECGRAIPGRCHRRRGGGGQPRAEGYGVGSGPEASAGDSLSEGGGVVPGSLGSRGDSLSLCQADERLAEKAKPVYQELLEAFGTRWRCTPMRRGRIRGQGAWLWVFTGPRGTVYTIDRRRSYEVVVEVLGLGFSGVLVTDCFRAYDHQALTDWS